MAGVKSLLKAAANDLDQTSKATIKPTEPISDTHKSDKPTSNIIAKADDLPKNSKPKSTGGRPTNKIKGIKNRKQYTLTLKEDTYKLILDEARKEDLSFAKYMERAAIEYIENHK